MPNLPSPMPQDVPTAPVPTPVPDWKLWDIWIYDHLPFPLPQEMYIEDFHIEFRQDQEKWELMYRDAFLGHYDLLAHAFLSVYEMEPELFDKPNWLRFKVDTTSKS